MAEEASGAPSPAISARQGAENRRRRHPPESAKLRTAEITGQGGNAFTVVVDVTNKKSVQEWSGRRWSVGENSIFWSTSRSADPKLVIDMEESDWDHIVNMNLKSVFLCSQAVLPTMIQQRYGKIVSISSIYGFTGCETRSNYAAAKAGVAVFTKSLALEVVKDGINVNAIAPGRVATERVRGRYSDEEWAKRVAAIPLGRAATPEEIAPTALFLVQDQNRYITGQTVHVNGAWLNW